MYNFLTKNGTMVAFGLGLLVVAIFYLAVFPGLETFNAVAEGDQPTSDAGDIFLPGIYATVALIVIAFAAWLLFGLFHAASAPKGAIKGLVGIAALVGIFFILYSIADPNNISPKIMEEFDISDGISKFVGASIGLTLVLMVGAVLAFIVGSIARFFR